MIDISTIPDAKPDFIDEDRNQDVYTIHQTYGAIEFRVPTGTPVKRQDSRWGQHRASSTNPRTAFPNMEVRDEAIVLPFCDLVELIIARADPIDLAKSLWANDDVRGEFRSCLTREYNVSHVVDDDRRKFLAEVKEAVHSKELSALTEKISDVEHEVRARWRSNRYTHDYNAHYFAVLESIEHLYGSEARKEIERRHLARFSRPFDDGDFGIGKKHWNECRDFWRAKTLELFPGPGIPETTTGDDPWGAPGRAAPAKAAAP